MDLREIGLGGVDWIRLAQGQGPAAGCCECGDEPSGSCATELVSYMLTVPAGSREVTAALKSISQRSVLLRVKSLSS
jgi:hypothetical protein